MKKVWIPTFLRLRSGQVAGMTILLIFLFISSPVLANHIGVQSKCDLNSPNGHCKGDLVCQRSEIPATADEYQCFNRPSEPLGIFGKIIPPQAIQNLGFGSTGISKFLTNLIRLIYVIAAVALIFMILWGAFDWMTSEGDKEKLERARNKLINAIIGIILFAAAFAIIQILGQFTGFQFFST